MWRLRNPRPCPPHYTEHCYSEVVEVKNGECTVEKWESRDRLLCKGFILIEEVKSEVQVDQLSKPTDEPLVTTEQESSSAAD